MKTVSVMRQLRLVQILGPPQSPFYFQKTNIYRERERGHAIMKPVKVSHQSSTDFTLS